VINTSRPRGAKAVDDYGPKAARRGDPTHRGEPNLKQERDHAQGYPKDYHN
jgi:hypothetical protein